MYAGVTISVGRIVPNMPIQASFPTSVPAFVALSPSELIVGFTHGPKVNCEGRLMGKERSFDSMH